MGCLFSFEVVIGVYVDLFGACGATYLSLIHLFAFSQSIKHLFQLKEMTKCSRMVLTKNDGSTVMQWT